MQENACILCKLDENAHIFLHFRSVGLWAAGLWVRICQPPQKWHWALTHSLKIRTSPRPGNSELTLKIIRNRETPPNGDLSPPNKSNIRLKAVLRLSNMVFARSLSLKLWLLCLAHTSTPYTHLVKCKPGKNIISAILVAKFICFYQLSLHLNVYSLTSRFQAFSIAIQFQKWPILGPHLLFICILLKKFMLISMQINLIQNLGTWSYRKSYFFRRIFCHKLKSICRQY